MGRVGSGHGSERIRVKTGQLKKGCFGSGRNMFGSERVGSERVSGRDGLGSERVSDRIGSVKKC
ncbi:hypothetical protein Hanom_Chr03g00240201 [Helianthus anomalus]